MSVFKLGNISWPGEQRLMRPRLQAALLDLAGHQLILHPSLDSSRSDACVVWPQKLRVSSGECVYSTPADSRIIDHRT